MGSHLEKSAVLLFVLISGFIVISSPAGQSGSNVFLSMQQPPSALQANVSVLSDPVQGTFFDHVVVLMMENRALVDICGFKIPPPCNGNMTSSKPATPFMANTANNYTIATQYTSVFTPLTSAPNYVALIGGSTFNCSSGGCGGAGTITASNLVDRLVSDNLSWKAYFENYPSSSGCFSTGPAPYDGLHNPFIWFNDIYHNSTRCANLVNANPSACTITDCVLINDLNGPNPPSYAWLTPNDCNNSHGSDVCTDTGCLSPSSTYRTACIIGGDNYLKGLVPLILNSTVFRTQRSALFITFDEGVGAGGCPFPDPSGEDCLYTVWAGPVTKTNKFTSNSFYNHYSALKTIETNWNLGALQTNDMNAVAMREFFTPDFSISANPNALIVSEGNTANSTITISSLSNFNGTVKITATSNPNGPTLNLSLTNVTISAHQSIISILSFSSTVSRDYTVTVTATNATSGKPVHTVSIDVTVTTGTVGGVVIQVDKLRLILPFFAQGILVPVSVATAVVIVKKLKRARVWIRATTSLPAGNSYLKIRGID